MASTRRGVVTTTTTRWCSQQQRRQEHPPRGFSQFFGKKKAPKQQQQQQQATGGGGPEKPPDVGPRLVSTLAALGLVGVWLSRRRDSLGSEINWQEFATVLLESGQVERVIVTNNKIAEVQLRNSPQQSYHFSIGSVEIFERKLEAAQRALGIEPRDFVPVQYVSETNWGAEAAKFLPTLLIVGSWLFVMRSMGGSNGSNIFRIGRASAKKITKEEVNVRYSDVAGCDEAKKEVKEFVDFLKDPLRFTKLGAKIPRGALLSGPPGTGKTLLAKATAGEASVPFYAISGSEFVEMFVGVGPSRVRDLFKEARANAPCIVFIDEIDAVGRQRGRGGFAGGNDERENTLNQLLVEMDGFQQDETTVVVVLAGTNRADVLDKALTRPGRFDRTIFVDKPDLKGRKAIFEVHLKNINLDGTIQEYASRLAGLTPGFTGADIANICNEAAIVAARRSKEKVQVKDFETAADRVIGGLESHRLMTSKEKRIVAFHEAGHAVAGWFLEHADPLLKVTIVPRASGALGFAQYLPSEVALRTRDQIFDIVCMALGGRASEQLIFGQVTTGAQDDLRKVTTIAYSMIQQYGMGSSQLAFPEAQQFESRPYSESTAKLMDEEAKAFVDKAYDRVLGLLEEKKSQVSQLAELLIQQETVNHDDIVKLLGQRPFKPDDQYAHFIGATSPPPPPPPPPLEEEQQQEEGVVVVSPGSAEPA
ncbi:hypothetical protein CTAYLR_008204 [Chrysophaeum taylorii]|uniref:AAA+ ATPase domain-containing protein n=1 Tax=Chrysophaeum taylorii TaxID=2483200 RepID=A0AAD7UAL7_9STRA|nr:hypothetical protein CTAYLR_008204 [Chrysophaeum taylorii]